MHVRLTLPVFMYYDLTLLFFFLLTDGSHWDGLLEKPVLYA
jgi:hypothetical protein